MAALRSCSARTRMCFVSRANRPKQATTAIMAIAFTRRAVCTEVISAIQPSRAGPTISPAPQDELSQRYYRQDAFLHCHCSLPFCAARAKGRMTRATELKFAIQFQKGLNETHCDSAKGDRYTYVSCTAVDAQAKAGYRLGHDIGSVSCWCGANARICGCVQHHCNNEHLLPTCISIHVLAQCGILNLLQDAQNV